MILFIDNYDSFVHNLARYFERLGQAIHVVRNDAITIEQIDQLTPSAIVISPGPCGPEQAGICREVIQHFSGLIPILGICLGHQAIAHAFGGRIVRASTPMHGRTSQILHHENGIFKSIRSPLTACRYHSLVAEHDSLPTCLEITATADDGTIMAIQHQTDSTFGIQFHPESILTNCGFEIAANFLRLCGIPTPATLPTILDELKSDPAIAPKTPSTIRTIWNPEFSAESEGGKS